MNSSITVDRGAAELLSEVQPLWEALFDRHVEYGAAGLATIQREDSWPRRLAHYVHLFAQPARATVFLARLDGTAVGYALGYDEELLGEPAVVLETLSLLPAVRGGGLGTRLIQLVDQQARDRGATMGIVDVLSGNTPAFGFYRKAGFAPYSETWMRSEMQQADERTASDGIAEYAGCLGLHLDTAPGPDDTWVSSDSIAHLSPSASGVPNLTADTTALETLFASLEKSGLWSIQVTIPATAQAEAWRDMLGSLRFKPCLHRLTRPI